MGLRPARTVRVAQGQKWARISTARPRKSYVKGAPRPKVRQYEMGTDKYYTTSVELVAQHPIFVRDNALEAARQAANKYLEKTLLIDNYFFKLLKYPHLVIREHSALGVAGADRISKGMKKAFGRPKGRMAEVGRGESLFRVYCGVDVVPEVKIALMRAKLKLSGDYEMVVADITTNAVNLAKKGKAARLIKVKEEAKPVAEVAATAEGKPGAPVAGQPAPTAAGKEGEKAKEPAAAGKEAKPEKKG